MSYEIGAVKYFVNTLLTAHGYVAFYIFGDGIWNTVEHFQAVLGVVSSENPEEAVDTLIVIYTPSGPEGWLLSLIVYPIVGGSVATILWYLFTPRY